MKKINFSLTPFYFIFLMASCGHQSNQPMSAEAVSLKNGPKKSPRKFDYPEEEFVSPGKLTLVTFEESEKVHDVKCDGKKVYYARDGKMKYVFYLSLSYFEKTFSDKSCIVTTESTKQVIKLVYKDFPYKREYLKVDKKRVFLSKENQKRVEQEQLMLNSIYADKINDRLFSSSFKVPLNSYITSHYGNKRVFNGKKESQHLGNDFRARIGTKIPVSNDGRVVFTGNLFYSGNTVIVYHGLDIFTVYAHLSRYKVKRGDVVKKGQIVGLSGMTGRVSGPHLHWGVKVSGNWVDGFSLVDVSKAHFTNQNQTSLH